MSYTTRLMWIPSVYQVIEKREFKQIVGKIVGTALFFANMLVSIEVYQFRFCSINLNIPSHLVS